MARDNDKEAMSPVPIPDSYWVISGLLLAGEYPGSLDPSEARSKLRALVDSGIELFLDLTYGAAEGLRPYAEELGMAVTETGRAAKRVNLPIPDAGVPARDNMVQILNVIDQAIASEMPVYVHCWGGIGRTGTVVGCYLARHELVRRGDTIRHIADLRRDTPDGGKPSPENALQCSFVESWRAGE